MTELLKQVIAEIQELPADQQDAIASRLMAELKDEQRWTKYFESTTDEQWDRLADMVRQEISDGDTVAIAEKISALMTENYLKERAKRGSRAKYEAILAKVPDVKPETYDIILTV
ncbi:hypothetical protein [Planktothrix agardhii]|jgi:RNA polymerase-interacting CarD/CdnL/TRCF family regulator|uniref:Uncharacterized protein n=1 Tax=Planktothrix agardhii TaxID=1160 RepID=A0AAD1V5H1_PLAAG|nr:hypothetical protein [Planktothrix agardhii]CAD5936899.1 hypothetical protein PANO66_01720 [Planktothrix agardhii]